MNTLWMIVGCGVLAILYGIWATRSVISADAGSQKMQEISAAVAEGAQAYLKRQYTTIGIVGAVIFVIIGFTLGWLVAVGFAIGAILSGATGFIGMNVSVRANVRVAQAATKSLAGGLELAFKSGAITGMLVAGLALLGVTLYFGFLTGTMHMAPNDRTVIDAIVALGFGASLISIFARLGGGIFTKGADVGGDLVGKVEAGIPEDDPRNPATIADNVGDNVGDCAGMAADLFETYAVTIVATMVLASIFFATTPVLANMMTYPLAIGGVCIITSIIGTFFVRLGASQSIMGALYKGFIASAVLSLGRHLVCHLPADRLRRHSRRELHRQSLFICAIVGLVVTGLIIWVTEYYTGTDYRPVKSIAAASVTGHGTNVIQGLAISMEATALPAVIIIAGILIAYGVAGLFGIAIAVTADAGARRHGGGARRLRPGHRQCRRHCRNGRPAEGSAQSHRRARRGRQHHQGDHQGLCDRLGRPGRAGAVCGLQSGSVVLRQGCRGASVLPGRHARFRADQSLRRGRTVVRRHAAISVRVHGHDRGRPRRRRDRRGGAPAVPRKPGHHERHGQAGLWPRRRPADQGGDQGNDRAVAAAGAVADRLSIS